MHAESGIHDRDTEVGPLLSTEPSQSAENDAPSSGGMPALISTASEVNHCTYANRRAGRASAELEGRIGSASTRWLK
jgi:hypothetical protein